MDPIQQIIPISEMKLHHAEVLTLLTKGPVVLAQRSRPAAVLISITDWDAIAARVKRLELLADAHRISAEMDRDPTRVTSHEELRRQLAAKAQP